MNVLGYNWSFIDWSTWATRFDHLRDDTSNREQNNKGSRPRSRPRPRAEAQYYTPPLVRPFFEVAMTSTTTEDRTDLG